MSDCIQSCGPPSCWWQFTIERLLGCLGPMILSKSSPWTNLANQIIQRSQLDIVIAMLGETRLSPVSYDGEKGFLGKELCTPLPEYKLPFIARYLCQLLVQNGEPEQSPADLITDLRNRSQNSIDPAERIHLYSKCEVGPGVPGPRMPNLVITSREGVTRILTTKQRDTEIVDVDAITGIVELLERATTGRREKEIYVFDEGVIHGDILPGEAADENDLVEEEEM
ncbi:hypothetical protein RUND412_007105 [Rhizina undulata]